MDLAMIDITIEDFGVFDENGQKPRQRQAKVFSLVMNHCTKSLKKSLTIRWHSNNFSGVVSVHIQCKIKTFHE